LYIYAKITEIGLKYTVQLWLTLYRTCTDIHSCVQTFVRRLSRTEMKAEMLIAFRTFQGWEP